MNIYVGLKDDRSVANRSGIWKVEIWLCLVKSSHICEPLNHLYFTIEQTMNMPPLQSPSFVSFQI